MDTKILNEIVSFNSLKLWKNFTISTDTYQ